MTPTDPTYWTDLGRRAVAWDKWQWRGGALPCEDQEDGTMVRHFRIHDIGIEAEDPDSVIPDHWFPDFRDGPTTRCLLAQLREARPGDVVVVIPPEHPTGKWTVEIRLFSLMRAGDSAPEVIRVLGPTEAEALVVAAEGSS